MATGARVTEPPDHYEPPRVWRDPRPLAAAVSTGSFGGIAAPLLAGFSLAAIVTLTGDDDRGLRGDTAVLLFAIAVGFLLYAVQCAAAAAAHQTSPADRLAWFPQYVLSDRWLNQMRDQQWQEADMARRLREKTRIGYNLGIVAFLSGLTAALLPGPGDWTPPRIGAVAVAALAILIELLWWAGWPRRLVEWIAPGSSRKPRVRTPTPRPGYIPEVELRRILLGQPPPNAMALSPAPDGGVQLEELAGRVDALYDILAQLDRRGPTVRNVWRRYASWWRPTPPNPAEDASR